MERITNLYFVRHAEPDYSVHQDEARPLTEKGKRDTALVCDYLKGRGITQVYSSPFVRAVDTVRPLADRIGVLVLPMEAFRERKTADVWIEDFNAYAQQQWNDFSFKETGGESLSEVQQRNIEGIEKLLGKHAGENIAVGSHGTALSTVLNYYNPAFGYEAFMEIVRKMPFIVHLVFKQRELCHYTLRLFE